MDLKKKNEVYKICFANVKINILYSVFSFCLSSCVCACGEEREGDKWALIGCRNLNFVQWI
jgi:hypothetical protein